MPVHKLNSSNILSNKALFLDRDGVINVDDGYVHASEQCTFVEGIFDLVAAAKQKGYLVIVITNQAGIGRGYYTEAQFHQFMKWMNIQFKGQLDAIYFCPYHAEHGIGQYKQHSLFRKPEPGMLLQACREHQIDPRQSLMIGDSEKDMQAASRAKIAKKLFFSDKKTDQDCIVIKRIIDSISYL